MVCQRDNHIIQYNRQLVKCLTIQTKALSAGIFMHFNAGEPSREKRFSTLITRVLNFICFSQKHNIKDIIVGMGLGALVFSIFIGIYYYFNIGMFFLSQGGDVSSSSSNTAGGTVTINVFYLRGRIIWFFKEVYCFFIDVPNVCRKKD